jgi:hypothetical protein
MTIRFRKSALALICSSFAFPAVADEVSNTHNSYVSFSGGKSQSSGACSTTYIQSATCSEKGKVYRLGYGYHLTPTWGMEISYGDFGQAKEEGVLPYAPPGVPGGGPIPYVRTFQAVGWEIATTGTLHFGKSFSLIGKLGVLHADVGQEIILTTPAYGIWHAVDHDTRHHITTSIGAQYDFNKDFALRIQYDRYGKLGDLSRLYTGATSKIDVSAAFASVILKF